MLWGRTKILLVFSSAIVFTIAMFLFSCPAKADEPDPPDHIVINEIYPNPSSGDEFVEIYNPAGTLIDFSGYQLKKTTPSSSSIKSTLGTFCLTTDVYYYLCDTGTNWLINTGATVSLILSGSVIDNVTYPDFSNHKGQSFARIPNGIDTDDDGNDFRIVLPTLGSENILPVYSDLVYINEILPQPATSSADEFIELFNSGTLDLDLSGWQIDDIADGGSSPYTIPVGTIITAEGYLVFYNSTDHITLNDSGDSARLIDPNGDEKSDIIYTSSNRGQSYSKFDSGWQWTETSTPISANILTVEINSPEADNLPIITDIPGAKNQPDGTLVKVDGIVSVVPGVLSTQYFYIQDNASGIQIYSYGKNFPILIIGDEISVVGEMKTTAGERRIEISLPSDIAILSTHPPPTATKTTISTLGQNKNFAGQYISVIGTVEKTSGSTFYIHGSGEIEVIIRTSANIQKPRMHVGDKVQIAGILSSYNGNLRLLPTRQSDVKIISALPNSGSNVLVTFLISVALTILSWIIYQKVKKKQKIWRQNFCRSFPN